MFVIMALATDTRAVGEAAAIAANSTMTAMSTSCSTTPIRRIARRRSHIPRLEGVSSQVSTAAP